MSVAESESTSLAAFWKLIAPAAVVTARLAAVMAADDPVWVSGPLPVSVTAPPCRPMVERSKPVASR